MAQADLGVPGTGLWGQDLDRVVRTGGPKPGCCRQVSGGGPPPHFNKTRDNLVLVVGMHMADPCGPADAVVGEHGAAQPGCIGEEVPEGAVLEAGALFDVADGEFDGGVVAVELVERDDSALDVGDERVVTPLGP